MVAMPKMSPRTVAKILSKDIKNLSPFCFLLINRNHKLKLIKRTQQGMANTVIKTDFVVTTPFNVE